MKNEFPKTTQEKIEEEQRIVTEEYLRAAKEQGIEDLTDYTGSRDEAGKWFFIKAQYYSEAERLEALGPMTEARQGRIAESLKEMETWRPRSSYQTPLTDERTVRIAEGLKWLEDTKEERDKWLEENGGHMGLIGKDLNEIPWMRTKKG